MRLKCPEAYGVRHFGPLGYSSCAEAQLFSVEGCPAVSAVIRELVSFFGHLKRMANSTPNRSSKVRQFLILVILGFSFVISAYWTFSEQGVALFLIERQVAIFDGYYYLKLTLLLTWLSVMVVCLPVAFVIGWVCDRLKI